MAPGFDRRTGIKVETYNGNDVCSHARAGMSDLVISHYGRQGAERFVMEGCGAWPKIVFSDQGVLIGRRSDPAGVREMTSLAAAQRLATAALQDC